MVPHRPRSLETIGDLAPGYTLRIYCDACGRYRDVDPVTASPDLRAVRILEHRAMLACTECGAKQASITIGTKR